MYGISGRRILLVEDNPGDAELIADLLPEHADAPGGITLVTRLGDALRTLASQPIDAVLLDLGLPDATGVRGVSELRAQTDRVPIVVLTGNEDHELALECIAAGAQDYLAKSEINEQSLRRAIGYALARVGEETERIRADTLKETMAAIVDASTDAIVSSSMGGIVTSWNVGAERIFGFTREEAIGRLVVEVMPGPDCDAERDQAQRVLGLRRGQTESEPAEVVRLRRDGTPVTLSIVGCSLRDASGRITGVAGICRDISEKKQREEELRRSNAQLLARERKMRALTRHLNAVREEERTRISREVHDVLGQLLTGLAMDLRWLDRRLSSGACEVPLLRARLAEADALARQTIAEVQRVALELRPSALDSLGLQAALRDEARRFEARSGVPTFVEIKGAARSSPTVATALFRIAQELLTNVARHAQATSVSILLADEGPGKLMQVADDGVGIAGDAWERAASLGLLGMRERVEAVGGTLEVARRPQGGTLATVRVPT